MRRLLDDGLIRLSEEFDLGAVRGLLLNAPKPNRLRFMPALNTAQVQDGLELLRQIFVAPASSRHDVDG